MKKFTKIVGGFTKTIDKLDRLSESNAGRAEVKLERIEVLEGEVAELSTEATQAALMADKLRAFLEV